MPRSMAMPTRRGDQKSQRHRHRQRPVDGQPLLRQPGGIGAQHHQLAVRHVDHAHHPESDRQPDGGQNQHRSQRQPEEQGFRPAQQLQAELGATQGFSGRLAHAGIAIIGRHPDQRASNLRLHPPAQRLGGLGADGRVVAGQIGQRQRRRQQVLDPAVRFHRQSRPQRRRARRVGIAQEGFDRRLALLGIGAGESQTGQPILDQTAQPVVGGDPVQAAFADRSQGFAGHRVLDGDLGGIVQADDSAVTLFLVIQPAVGQGFQNRGDPWMVRGHQLFDQFGLAVEIGIAQLRQGGAHFIVIGGAGRRRARTAPAVRARAQGTRRESAGGKAWRKVSC